MTRSGNRRSRWTTVAGLAIVALVAVALTAAAQPAPPAAQHPGMASGMAPCAGMGKGMGAAMKGEMGPAAGAAMPCGMGPGAGPGMDCCKGPGHGGPGFRRGGARMQEFSQHLLMAAEKIGLTDAQKTQLRELRHRGPATIMPKQQALMEARMDFQDSMAKKDAPAAEIRKAHDKLLKAQSDLRAAAFDLRMQAREVLTPEQREKLHDGMRHGAGPGQMGMVTPDDDEGDDFEAEF